jgi:NADH dehydrogenase
MMRVAVIGGSGFVGRRLCLALHAAGHSVRVVTRRRETHRELLVLPDLQVVETDVHNPVALKNALAGVDAVVNLVGILNESRRQSFAAVHAELPEKIVQACRQNGIARLLHMSALNAAPDGASDYLRSKGQGEARVQAAHGSELAVTVFRPSVIFGPGDHFINMFAALLRVAPGVFPLACAGAQMQPVHVDDVAHAMTEALTLHATHGQRYNLCGPRAYTLKEILELIARHEGRRVRILPLPRALSRLQAQLLQWAPGKPFTPDNFRSLQVASVCEGPFPGVFGIVPKSLEMSLPAHS